MGRARFYALSGILAVVPALLSQNPGCFDLRDYSVDITSPTQGDVITGDEIVVEGVGWGPTEDVARDCRVSLWAAPPTGEVIAGLYPVQPNGGVYTHFAFTVALGPLLSDLPDGLYWIEATYGQATDKVGITVDRGTPFAVHIDEPAESATVRGVFSVRTHVDDRKAGDPVHYDVSFGGVTQTRSVLSTDDPTASEIFEFDSRTTPDGRRLLTVTARDGRGRVAQDEVSIQVRNRRPGSNLPPYPPSVWIEPPGPGPNDDLLAHVSATDPNGDALTLRYEWSKDGVVQPTLDADTVPASETDVGETWRCTVYASDGEYESQGYDEVTILNHPPGIAGVEITPDPAVTVDALTATAGGVTDPDGDPVTLTYRWYQDGALHSEETKTDLTSTMASGQTAKHEVWRCEVTPNDGADDGTSASDEVTIRNSKPSATVHIAPVFPKTDDDLIAIVTGSDADGDAVTVQYEWLRDGALQAHLTADTVAASETANGQTWTCRATPNDGEEEGAPAEAAVQIGGSPPTAPTVVITPAAPYATDALHAEASGSVDPDDPAATIEYMNYEWWRVPAGSYVFYKIADGQDLPAGSGSRGDALRCQAQARNVDTGEIGPPGSASVTVLNSPPTLDGVRIAPKPAYAWDTLTATPLNAADPDSGDTVAISYQWQRLVGGNYEDLPGATGSTLDSSHFARGDWIQVLCTADDGTASSATVADEVEIRDAPPTTPGVRFDPANPTSSDVLRLVVDPESTDPDGDPVTYHSRWYHNSNGPLPAFDDVWEVAPLVRGDTYQAFIWAESNGVVSATVWVQPVTIGNSPPGAPQVSISPAAPTPADDLTAVIDTQSSDVDGDAVTYSYAWSKDGALQGHLTTAAAPAAETAAGEEWTVTVTPNDGFEAGPAGSATATIAAGGTPPTVQIVSPPDGSTLEGVEANVVGTAAATPATVVLRIDDSHTDTRAGLGASFDVWMGFYFGDLPAGDYTLTATVTDAVGLTASDSITVHRP